MLVMPGMGSMTRGQLHQRTGLVRYSGYCALCVNKAQHVAPAALPAVNSTAPGAPLPVACLLARMRSSVAAGGACAGERFTPLLPGMCACIAQLKPEQQHNMSKLLASWRSEACVPGSIISACEDKLPALADAAPAGGGEHHGERHHDQQHAAASGGEHQQHGGHSPAPPAAVNGGYTGASDYVQAMAAAAVAAAAAATAAHQQQQQVKQLTPAKRVSCARDVWKDVGCCMDLAQKMTVVCAVAEAAVMLLQRLVT